MADNILAGAIKSKTVNFNIIAAAILEILQLLGVAVPIPVITIGLPLANILLRFLTKQPLSEK